MISDGASAGKTDGITNDMKRRYDDRAFASVLFAPCFGTNLKPVEIGMAKSLLAR